MREFAERLTKEDFFEHTADFNTTLTQLKARVRDTASEIVAQQKSRLLEGLEDLRRLAEWEELTQEERGNAASKLDGLLQETSLDLAGLKKLLAQDYDINTTIAELKKSIQRQGQERIRKRLEDGRKNTAGESTPGKLRESITWPARITSAQDLDILIQQLNEIKSRLGYFAEIELMFTMGRD